MSSDGFDLRQRYIEAIGACERPTMEDLADAVMAVRDEELERLQQDLASATSTLTELAPDGMIEWRERAEAAIARVRALAEEWEELAERGDPCAERVDLAIADCGRDVLAALDSQSPTVEPETPAEEEET